MKILEKTEKQPGKDSASIESANAETQVNTYLPRTDIVDSESEVRIWAEMPGLDNGSVNITLEKNVLTLEGKVKIPIYPEGYSLKVNEYPVGNYRRTFRLGQDFNYEDIQAKMTNGVLCLVLPKSKDLGPKKINVKAE